MRISRAEKVGNGWRAIDLLWDKREECGRIRGHDFGDPGTWESVTGESGPGFHKGSYPFNRRASEAGKKPR
jgi:hypothetical protein